MHKKLDYIYIYIYIIVLLINSQIQVTENSNKIAIHLVQYTTNGRGYKRYESCSLLNILYCSQLPWSAVIFSYLVQLETLLTHIQTKYRF